MKLLLHIGTEKTGSTAIQKHLQAHQDDLAQIGVVLPTFLDSSNHRALASLFIADDLDDDYLRAHQLVEVEARRKERALRLEQLGDAIEEAEGAAHTMVISSEHFHSRLLAEEEVRAFADAVSPLFESVSVVCYLRRQDHMALSFYTQKLRAGFVPPSILPIANIRKLVSGLPPYFDFEALLDRWANCFGEESIEPVIYDRRTLVGGDVVNDFCHRLGLEDYSEVAKLANASLSSAGQMALLAFNRQVGGDLDSRARHKGQRDSLAEFLQEHANGLGVTPPELEAEEFLAAFTASNQRVAARWFGRRELFSDLAGIADNPVYPDWEGSAELLAAFYAAQGDGA